MSNTGDSSDDEEVMDGQEDKMREESDIYSLFFGNDPEGRLELKVDHSDRPCYITADRKVVLEAFSPLSKQAQDFLVAIAEPVTRPNRIHEYRITEFSLYAAISVGLETNGILSVLHKLSKTLLPSSVEEFIREKTMAFGKVKLVLKNGEYWIESMFEDVISALLKDSIIRDARTILNSDGNGETGEEKEWITIQVDPVLPFTVGRRGVSDQEVKDALDGIDLFEDWSDDDILQDNGKDTVLDSLSDTEMPDVGQNKENKEKNNDACFGDVITIDHQDEADKYLQDFRDQNYDSKKRMLVNAFQIKKESVSDVRKQCSALNFPLSEEYDFRKDQNTASLDIDLKATTKLRDYQEEGLSKMFSSGRGRSGIIVLPCGAGKTLVGVTAACTIKKSCLVLCTSSVSVDQWAREFRYWSTVNDDSIGKFTADKKERVFEFNFNTKFVGDSGVLVSTYSMITYSGKRAYDAQSMMEFVLSQDWGLLILDEVHVVPADMFKKVFTIVTSHAKLGLTATLVREDDKIAHLNFLLGPKLYEANWLELSERGHIARVQCAQVWCSMTPEFFREYLSCKSRKRQLLYVMNPMKLQACQYLIEFHEASGDKTIVFSDNVFALKHYANTFNKPFIYGGTSSSERSRILHQFRYNPALNTIFLSKVGDTSIDLPEASCLIQISSHYGSRRQEAQRLGRILRAKKRSVGNEFNAFFYTLVSKDTTEMYYAGKRQQFLVDQGYSFRIITKLHGLENNRNLVYKSKAQQIDLLNTVLLAAEPEPDLGSSDQENSSQEESEEPPIRRIRAGLGSLSGGDSMAYLEFKRIYMRQRRS